MTEASVVLVGDAVASMVLAAERAQSAPGLHLAIIGGLAVTCRLGRVHRATGDVDAVADQVVNVAADSGAQVLIDSGVALPDPTGPDHRVFINGMKLEIIDTVALPSGASEIEPELSRLFLLGHRWALESARPMRVVVADHDVDVALQVAMPAALVATKLHAYCDRQRDEKRASDAYDIFRILDTRDAEGEVAEAVNNGPGGLA